MSDVPYLSRSAAIHHLHHTAAAFCLGTASLATVSEAVHLALRARATGLDINSELREHGLSWDEQRDAVLMRS